MGITSWFSSPSSASSSSSSNEPPSRAERDACHGARDAYFACLDREKLALAGTGGEQGGKCAEANKLYMDKCPASWVRRLLRLAGLGLMTS